MGVAGNHHGQKQLVKTVVSVLISGFLYCPNDIPIHDHVQAGGPLARKVNMRETARTTWLQLGNSNLIRRALLEKTRQQRESFVPGETV